MTGMLKFPLARMCFTSSSFFAFPVTKAIYVRNRTGLILLISFGRMLVCRMEVCFNEGWIFAVARPALGQKRLG